MWAQSGLCLQPQSSHFTITCCLLGVKPNSSPLSKLSLVCMSSCNVARTHPYAHPQHMKVVKRFVCIWHWYGTNLGCVYSLNHLTSPLLVAWKLLRILALTSKSLVSMSSCNVARTHPYAHPQHMKVVKHFVYVWHWCESIWVGFTAPITALHHDLKHKSKQEY